MDGSVKIHSQVPELIKQSLLNVRFAPSNAWMAIRKAIALASVIEMSTPELRAWLLDVLRQVTGQMREDQHGQTRLLKRRATELPKQHDRLMTLLLQDEIDAALFQRVRNSLRHQINETQATLSKLGIAEQVFDFTQNPSEGWKHLDIDGKQRVLRAVSSRRTVSCRSLQVELRKAFSWFADTGLQSCAGFETASR